MTPIVYLCQHAATDPSRAAVVVGMTAIPGRSVSDLNTRTELCAACAVMVIHLLRTIEVVIDPNRQ